MQETPYYWITQDCQTALLRQENYALRATVAAQESTLSRLREEEGVYSGYVIEQAVALRALREKVHTLQHRLQHQLHAEGQRDAPSAGEVDRWMQKQNDFWETSMALGQGLFKEGVSAGTATAPASCSPCKIATGMNSGQPFVV